MLTESFTGVGKLIETLIRNFKDFISLYQNLIQQLYQGISFPGSKILEVGELRSQDQGSKEMYARDQRSSELRSHHDQQSEEPRSRDQESVRPRAQSDHQDLINTYAEYIAELDEFFNYPNSRGDYE